MDEIEQRLRTATDACISSYDAWRKNQKQDGAREALLEAVHELRKVAARLEIEVAVSERDEMAARPIPIPPHRASRKPYGDQQGDDNIGNAADSAGNTAAGHAGNFRDQGSGGHRGGGGGHRHGGGGRRRMGMGHGQGGDRGGGGGNRDE